MQGLRDLAIVDSIVTGVPGNLLISNSTVQVRGSFLGSCHEDDHVVLIADHIV